MKKRLLTLFAISLTGISLSVLLSSSSNGRAFSANSGNTGAPGETLTCRSCHGTGFGASVNLVVKNSQGFPVSSYIPGTTYEVEVSVNTSSGTPLRYGFQALSLLSGNVAYNAWSNPAANTRIASAGARSYAEHAGKSTTPTFKSDWTAPAAGSGSVSFYAGGAAVNNNGNTAGDGGNTTTFTLAEGTNTAVNETELSAEDLLVFPNPAKEQLSIQFPRQGTQTYSLRLVDAQGRIKLNTTISAESFGPEVLDISHLSRGIYFVLLNNSGKALLSKRIVLI